MIKNFHTFIYGMTYGYTIIIIIIIIIIILILILILIIILTDTAPKLLVCVGLAQARPNNMTCSVSSLQLYSLA